MFTFTVCEKLTNYPNREMKNDEKVAGGLETRIGEIKKRYRVNQPKWPTGPATDFISWETYFMKIALTSKERSTHPEYRVKTISIVAALSHLLQVGACVVSPHKQVMSVGYNAYPEDMKHSATETEKEESAYS